MSAGGHILASHDEAKKLQGVAEISVCPKELGRQAAVLVMADDFLKYLQPGP